jgi:replicative DNA helicase
MEVLSDTQTEKAVLKYLIERPAEDFFELSDFLSENAFIDVSHEAVYRCIKELYDSNLEKIDIPTVLSTAKERKLSGLVSESLLKRICESPKLHNPIKLAARLRRLEIYRAFQDQLVDKQHRVEQLTGEESISEFLAITEFDLDSIVSRETSIKQIGENFLEKIKNKIENPVTQVGIPTGYPRFDYVIGGGLRDGSVNVITARIKVGKSHLLNNMAINIAKQGFPVLYIDTEMLTEEQQDRCAANFSKIGISNIETGQIAKEYDKMRLIEAAKEMESIPYYHCNVSGMPFEEQYAIMSKWIRKVKKPNERGEIARPVIVYDYLKMSTQKDISHNIAEYQMLGFMMTSLHNLAVRLKFPVLTAVQSNRDGIDKETTGIAAGSDRILWLCTNFSLFRPKSEEEVALDGAESGNRKLVTLATRFGPGMHEKDYINFYLDTAKSILTEGKLRSEIEHEQKQFASSINGDTEVPPESKIRKK